MAQHYGRKRRNKARHACKTLKKGNLRCLSVDSCRRRRWTSAKSRPTRSRLTRNCLMVRCRVGTSRRLTSLSLDYSSGCPRGSHSRYGNLWAMRYILSGTFFMANLKVSQYFLSTSGHGRSSFAARHSASLRTRPSCPALLGSISAYRCSSVFRKGWVSIYLVL